MQTDPLKTELLEHVWHIPLIL